MNYDTQNKNYLIEHVWQKQDLTLVAVMNLHSGCRCGYVGIPSDHFLHGIDYYTKTDKLNAYLDIVKDDAFNIDKSSIFTLFRDSSLRPEILFQVHGGLTYSSPSDDYPIKNDNLWWFGFDCAHYKDAPDPAYMPKYNIFSSGGVVRTLAFVISECESLADQLIDANNAYNFRKCLIKKEHTL